MIEFLTFQRLILCSENWHFYIFYTYQWVFKKKFRSDDVIEIFFNTNINRSRLAYNNYCDIFMHLKFACNP